MGAKSKLWYLSWAQYGKLAYSLGSKVKRSNQKFDLVVGIARGGIPLAMVVADALEIKMDIINVKSYTGIKERTKPAILSTLRGNIRGSRILLVDDLIEHGDTMDTVLSYLKRSSPSLIKTAVMFKKPWSKVEPDFCLRTVDKWVVFPWDIFETKRLMK